MAGSNAIESRLQGLAIVPGSDGVDAISARSGDGALAAEPCQERIGIDGTLVDEGEFAAVHRRLVEYARHRSALDAAEAHDLVRAEHMKMHIRMGHPTMLAYLERYLGYTPHTARERLRVSRSLVQLPLVTAHLARGTRR